MKLCKLDGVICELTNLQASPYDSYSPEMLDEVNRAALLGKADANKGCVRFFADGKVRSKAIAEIEITVNGLPQRNRYVIYHDKKGFFSIIQRQKIYLKDIFVEE